jgi:hypothetical protein
MTYTLTARLGLPTWTSDADIPTRSEFNLVTQYLESALVNGQTAHMDEWKDANGNVMSWVDPAGGFHGHYTDDANGWGSPVGGFQPNWINAGGYYYGLTQRLSGEHAQVRGQIQRLPGAQNLLLQVDTPYMPLNTQRFPVWTAFNGNEGGSWGAVALLIGLRDGGGDVPGYLRLFGATGGGTIPSWSTASTRCRGSASVRTPTPPSRTSRPASWAWCVRRRWPGRSSRLAPPRSG